MKETHALMAGEVICTADDMTLELIYECKFHLFDFYQPLETLR